MPLDTILKEIKTLAPVAHEEVLPDPINTYSGRLGRQRQAQVSLVDLKQNYTRELLRTAVFIVVTGAKRDAFTEIATNDKFKLFAANAETFYEDLANRIHPSLYMGKASPSNLFDVLGRHLEDKMNELNLSEYNQLVFKEKYIQKISTQEEFKTVLKTAINEQVGSEIVGIQAVNDITNTAISKNHSAKITPIVLNVNDQKFAVNLIVDLERLTNKVFLVVAGKAPKDLKSIANALTVNEVNEETIEATLAQIKNSLKNKEK